MSFLFIQILLLSGVCARLILCFALGNSASLPRVLLHLLERVRLSDIYQVVRAGDHVALSPKPARYALKPRPSLNLAVEFTVNHDGLTAVVSDLHVLWADFPTAWAPLRIVRR